MEIILKNLTSSNFFQNINCKIAVGKTTSIIGNNGSGKSALLSSLAFDNPLDEGEIYIKGKDLSNLKNKIGYLPQNIETMFHKKTVFEQLQYILDENNYPKSKQEQRKKDILKMLYLTSYQDRQINTLSNGEKKMLAIACVLIHNPKILILDEPFQYLDEKNLNIIIKILRLLKYRYKKTIIMGSVKTDLLHKLSDDIIVMDKGKIIAYGDKYSIFEQNKLCKLGIDVPKVIKISDIVKDEQNINIGYRDEINDLIKDIYRFIK